MPTYEYKCKKCDEIYEVYQSFSDDPLTECPSGDGGEVRKVFGNVGIVFKGSGFYKTDSRKEAKKASSNGSAKGSSGDSSSGTADSSASGDSKSSDSKSTDSKKKSSDSGKGSAKTTKTENAA